MPEYDETRYARLAAERFQTIHEEFQRAAATRWRSCRGWCGITTSRLPTARPCRPGMLAQLTRQHVTVALTGDGGDELFAGYPRYLAVWLAERLRSPAAAGCRRCWRAASGSGCPPAARQKSLLRRWKRFVEMLGQPPGTALPGMDCRFSARPAGRRSIATTSWPRCPTPIRGSFSPAAGRAAGRDPVTAVSLADLVTYLPCDLMTKVDIASMAHGLECRQPFLDYRVVELAAADARGD